MNKCITMNKEQKQKEFFGLIKKGRTKMEPKSILYGIVRML